MGQAVTPEGGFSLSSVSSFVIRRNEPEDMVILCAACFVCTSQKMDVL